MDALSNHERLLVLKKFAESRFSLADVSSSYTDLDAFADVASAATLLSAKGQISNDPLDQVLSDLTYVLVGRSIALRGEHSTYWAGRFSGRQSGFAAEFVNPRPDDQVAHTVGGLNIGYAYNRALRVWVMLDESEEYDIALYRETFDLIDDADDVDFRDLPRLLIERLGESPKEHIFWNESVTVMDALELELAAMRSQLTAAELQSVPEYADTLAWYSDPWYTRTIGPRGGFFCFLPHTPITLPGESRLKLSGRVHEEIWWNSL